MPEVYDNRDPDSYNIELSMKAMWVNFILIPSRSSERT